MKILLTGSKGGVGSAFMRLARAAGHEVATMERGDFARIEEVSEAWRDLDGVVFTNGVCPVLPLSKTGDEEFFETMKINCGLFLSVMREIVAKKKYSALGMRVVAVSSVSAVEGWAGGGAYCASKGALSALCRALDAELSPKKIRVLALEPRYIDTKMFENGAMRMGVKRSEAKSAEEFAREILGELGEP